MASAWETRFAEFVQRVTALRESGSLEVLHDLLPVLPVVDPEGPELHRLRGERLVRAHASFTAAAGELPTIEIAPRVANSLLIIEQLFFYSPTAQSVRLNGTNDSGFADLGASNKDEADSRYVGVGFPYAIGTVATAVAILTEGGAFSLPANTTMFVNVQYVIHPGFSLTIQGQGAATNLNCTFVGYTRTSGADELRSMT